MNRKLTGSLQYLMGIYAIIQGLSLSPGPLSLIAYDLPTQVIGSVPLYLLATLGPACVLLLGGAYLVVRNHRLLFAGAASESDSSLAASSAGVHSSVLSGAGLLLIGLALSDLPDVLAKVYAAYQIEREGMSFTQSGIKAAWIGCIGPAVQLCFGLFIFWKSSSLVTFLKRRRNRTTVTAADGQCPHCGLWVVSKDYAPDAQSFRCDNCLQEIPKEVLGQATDDSGK